MAAQSDNEHPEHPGSDVFVSYKREERDRILPIIERLRSLQLTIWFDAALDAGKPFDEEILQELSHARVHLVCWSSMSVESRWVRSEAALGAQRNILLPVFLERCQPRPPFNIDHIEDLTDWAGQPIHDGWLKVLSRIGQLTGRGSALRAYELLGGTPTTHMLRAFIADYPNDSLTPAIRDRVFLVELAETRARLTEELELPPNRVPYEVDPKLQSELHLFLQEVQRLKADRSRIETEFDAKIAGRNLELREVKESVQTLSHQLAERNSALEEANERRKSYERQIEELQEEVSQKQGIVDEVQFRLVRLEQELAEKQVISQKRTHSQQIPRSDQRNGESELEPVELTSTPEGQEIATSSATVWKPVLLLGIGLIVVVSALVALAMFIGRP